MLLTCQPVLCMYIFPLTFHFSFFLITRSSKFIHMIVQFCFYLLVRSRIVHFLNHNLTEKNIELYIGREYNRTWFILNCFHAYDVYTEFLTYQYSVNHYYSINTFSMLSCIEKQNTFLSNTDMKAYGK